MSGDVILIVDDEPVVLSSVSAALRFAGFLVISASSPEEALRAGLSHPSPIRLMVCDVLMPGLTGPRLAEEFGALHPETLFLFMAGFPDHPEVRDLIVARSRAFLPKPFLPRDLIAKVNSLLTGDDRLALSAGA